MKKWISILVLLTIISGIFHVSQGFFAIDSISSKIGISLNSEASSDPCSAQTSSSDMHICHFGHCDYTLPFNYRMLPSISYIPKFFYSFSLVLAELSSEKKPPKFNI